MECQRRTRHAGGLLVVVAAMACVGLRLLVGPYSTTSGWNSISGGNFDRIRNVHEVNPLVMISRERNPDNTYGVTMGVL